MNSLGIRLALAGGRSAIGALALTAGAVAVGTAILLYAAAFLPAMGDRDARTAWRDGFDLGQGSGTLVLVVEDRVDGETLTRVHVAIPDDATGTPGPVPPALTELPAPGDAYVSPALAARMSTMAPDALSERIGHVVGTIGDAWLASPDESIAIIGTEPEPLVAAGAYEVSAFHATAAALDLPPIGALIIVLAAVGALAPVAVFVATATRLSAARRELRLAALRLVGATPAQIARLATIEALVATSLGAAGGVILFALARPIVARVPLDGATWWPESITPPLPIAIGILLAVQLVGAVGALITMRRLTITPLGVQRRATPSRPGWWRVLPIAPGVVVLLGAVALYRTGAEPTPLLAVAGLAFAWIIASIAFAGPWLTLVVGRALHRVAAGASTLLAARRLEDEPRGSFGAIAGVVMAVFVASAFFTFSAYTRVQAGSDVDELLQPGAMVADLRGGIVLDGPDLERAILGIDGVTGVATIRSVALVVDDGIQAYGWLASCPAVAQALDLDAGACSPTGVTSIGGPRMSGPARIVPDASDPFGRPQPFFDLDLPDPAGQPLAAGEPIARWLPALLIDPAAVGGGAGAVGDFPVTSVYVTSDGTASVGEQVRTVVAVRAPSAVVRFETERVATSGQFEEIGRIVGLGLVGTMALAGCSLAVAVTTATLERRRQFVFLRSSGMPASGLRATILLQAGVPLAAVAAASALLGIAVGTGILWMASGGVLVLPDASLLGALIASLGVALGVVVLTLPPLERMTRPASLRHE